MPERRSDLEKLQDFAETTDRCLTEVFAGRRAEISLIEARIRDVQNRHWRGENNPAVGATTLIQGAPGAGKTSLIDKLRLDWIQAAEDEMRLTAGVPPQDWLPSVPDIASIDAEALNSPAALEADLRRAGQPLKATRRLVSVFTGYQFLGFGVSFDVPKPMADQIIRDASRPLVFFIDEIQNAKIDGMAGEFLNRMHSGNTAAPVIPVYAGLGNSREVLRCAGLSRLSDGAVISLGCLSEDEARESVDKFLSVFDVRAEASLADTWKEVIWKESQGWPHHLHNALRSLAEELIAAPKGDLAKVDMTAVRRRSAQRRGRYYADRISGEVAGARVLLGRFMTAFDGIGRLHDECIDLINSLQDSRAAATSLPDGMTAEGFFDAMIVKGLLQQTPRGDFASPIQSLRNWCVAATGGTLHTETFKGDIESVHGMLRTAGTDAPLAVSARDAVGRTPLHIAAEEGWPEIYDLLLKSGADPDSEDKDGRTAAEAGTASPFLYSARR